MILGDLAVVFGRLRLGCGCRAFDVSAEVPVHASIGMTLARFRASADEWSGLVSDAAAERSLPAHEACYVARSLCQAWSRSSRCGQLSLMATQILRTVTRTRAPIFKSFSRIVPH